LAAIEDHRRTVWRYAIELLLLGDEVDLWLAGPWLTHCILELKWRLLHLHKVEVLDKPVRLTHADCEEAVHLLLMVKLVSLVHASKSV
jgi:hypothetical protein